MSKAKVLVTHRLFEPVRKFLNDHVEAEFWMEPARMAREQLLRRVADKEGLICLLTDKVNHELLQAAPKLRIAATVSVGYDNIDVSACTQRRVIAINTPGVLDDTTADFAWALLMAISRRLVEGDAWVRSGTWPGWDLDQLCGTDVWGKTLGIIGFGRIGRELARRALGFKMRVLYYGRTRASEEIERELRAEFVDLDSLLAGSDFISLHVPLTPDTRHFINRETFSKMKPTAYLINTTRGPVVDEAALVAALEERRIAGAALDVYENEPAVHPGLLNRKDVVLSPHLGSASIETRTKMAMTAAENVVAVFQGKRPPNALNPEVLGM